jgi:hypothetical protein
MRIAPIKEEEVFLKPRLVIFYDVISDQEIQIVKDFASPRVNTYNHLEVRGHMHVQGDAGWPDEQGGGQEKNNRKILRAEKRTKGSLIKKSTL